MPLDRGLHAQMPLGGDLQCGRKGGAHVLGDAAIAAHPAGAGDLGQQGVAVETAVAREPFEAGIALQQVSVEDVAGIGDGEHRLDSCGGAGDQGNRAGGRDRGELRIAHGDGIGRSAVGEGGEGAAGLGQPR